VTASALPYDGVHVVADLYGAQSLDDLKYIDTTLRLAAAAAGATVLDVHLHSFGTGLGVTGVALLAESHISIHGWPEHGYAAVDIFICGRNHDAGAALAAIVARLAATQTGTTYLKRGYSAHTPGSACA